MHSGDTTTPDISILIVSYNCADDLAVCLRSIRSETLRSSYEIIVVDNHSHDNTTAMLKQDFPDVRLIENTLNTGFARANNQAMAVARGRFILYLNPDTEILNGAIDTMREYMEQRPDIGLLGPHTYNSDRRTTQATVYADHRLITIFHAQIPLFKHILRPSLVDAYKPATSCDVEVVRGCCIMARAEFVREIGGMNERYFMYGEDYELCRVVRKRGLRVVYLREASIVHSEGRSTSEAPDSPASRPALDVENYRNLFVYFSLHQQGTSLLALRLVLAAGCLWRFALFASIAPLFPSKRVNAGTHRRALAARLKWLWAPDRIS